MSTTLIAGFKDPDAVLFRKDFEFWRQSIHVIQTVDGAPEGYEGPVGLVTKYIPDRSFKDISNAAFICVGPPVMIRFAVAEILKLGVAEEQIWGSHERKRSVRCSFLFEKRKEPKEKLYWQNYRFARENLLSSVSERANTCLSVLRTNA